MSPDTPVKYSRYSRVPCPFFLGVFVESGHKISRIIQAEDIFEAEKAFKDLGIDCFEIAEAEDMNKMRDIFEDVMGFKPPVLAYHSVSQKTLWKKIKATAWVEKGLTKESIVENAPVKKEVLDNCVCRTDPGCQHRFSATPSSTTLQYKCAWKPPCPHKALVKREDVVFIDGNSATPS